MKAFNDEIVIYQSDDGAINFRGDLENENIIWGNLNQISSLFGRDKSVISRHIKNIFKSKELERSQTVAIFATVQKEGKRKIKRNIEYFNLDVILSVGYRVDSKTATKFRIWATKTLKKHIIEGYTINLKIIENNKEHFLKKLDDLKKIVQKNTLVDTKDVLSLIESFSNTFFTLESYDKNNFPKFNNVFEIQVDSKELKQGLLNLKKELINKGEATELFGQEKRKGELEGILGSVFQSVFGKDAYVSIEEKASHLLYFIVKNHPFNDGNKRSGAFAFIWLFQKANIDILNRISPETLATLTLLVAQSNPNEKDKIIGLILLLLHSNH